MRVGGERRKAKGKTKYPPQVPWYNITTMIKNKRILARVLMRDILSLLGPADFGLVAFDVADCFRPASALPHLSYSASELFDMFYEKLGDENRYILDNFSDIIIREGRMLSRRDAEALAAYYDANNKKKGLINGKNK